MLTSIWTQFPSSSNNQHGDNPSLRQLSSSHFVISQDRYLLFYFGLLCINMSLTLQFNHRQSLAATFKGGGLSIKLLRPLYDFTSVNFCYDLTSVNFTTMSFCGGVIECAFPTVHVFQFPFCQVFR
jgi:hypothetical protein